MSSVPPTPPPPSYTPPPPPPSYTPPPGGGGQSSNRTLMLVLSYLGLLALIPFFMEKEDREVQWHAKHGLVLTALFFVVWLVLTVMGQFDVGCISCPLFIVFGVAYLVVTILCIVKALNGQRFIIPGVSQYADKF